MTVALTVSFKLMSFLTFIFGVLLQYHVRHAPSFDRSQILLARVPSLSAEEYPVPFISNPYLPNVQQIN